MNDMAMFVTTLAAIVALGGVLYALIKTELRAEFGRLDGKIDALATLTDQRFAAIDQRFAALDQRFAAIDRRFDGLEAMLRPIADHLIGLGLAASAGKKPGG